MLKSPPTDAATADAASADALADVRPVASLGPAERTAMHALMAAHFGNAGRAAFERDLDEKDVAILLRDASGTLRGFSTLLRQDACAAGRPASVWFSGDTVVEAAHRHTASLPRAWSRHVFADARARPAVPTYWFLICSGYKTYRFLPTFYRRFLPAPDVPEDPAERALLGAVATARYGDRYDAATGLVRLAHPTPLRPGIADLTPARLRDPHVAFFAARNPGWARGDELACLCRIHPGNLTDAGRRMVGPDLAHPTGSPSLP